MLFLVNAFFGTVVLGAHWNVLPCISGKYEMLILFVT